MIELIKDVRYVAIGRHTNIIIATLLWIFALFTILYTFFQIILLTRGLYQDTYGNEEKIDGEFRFLLVKFKRIWREIL